MEGRSARKLKLVPRAATFFYTGWGRLGWHSPSGSQVTTPKTPTAKSFAKAAQGKKSTDITRERIEHDIAAFRKAGGKIEKLGNTPIFKKIG